jgi:hypothetical protein
MELTQPLSYGVIVKKIGQEKLVKEEGIFFPQPASKKVIFP